MSLSLPLPTQPLPLAGLEDFVLGHWQNQPPVPLVLCLAHESGNLRAVAHLEAQGLARPILVGDRRTMTGLLKRAGLDRQRYTLVPASTPEQAVLASLDLLSRGEARLLLRGRVLVHDLIKTFIASPYRTALIPRGSLLTHVGVLENPRFPRLVFVSDGGVVLRPDLNQKVLVIQNAVGVARCLGLAKPRVALLSAVETVSAGMPSSLDDAVLAKMAERGQIKNAVIDGPLSIDTALLPDVARAKDVSGPVAGQADVLIVHQIEVGNAIYKAMVVFGQSTAAGIIVGARFPIVVTSRSDSPASKICSIYLGLMALANLKS